MRDQGLAREDLALLSALAAGTSVRAAARALGVPRSTLSVRLAALEARLRGELFARQGRKLTPTAFGEVVLARTRAAQAALDRLEEAALESGAGGGRLVVAMAPAFADLVLPAVLARVLAGHPGARIELRASHGYVDLFAERVDVAVRRGPLADSTSLVARRLGALFMVYVASPALVRGTPAVTSEALVRALPWIRVGAGLEPLSIGLAGRRRRRAVTVLPRVAVDDQRLALALAEGGLGAVRVNHAVARPALDRGAVVEIVPEARASEGVFVVYPRHRQVNALRRDFVAALAAVCRDLPVWE